MQPVYKACPKCGTPADVNASSCASCGHTYRTQFNQTQFFPGLPQQTGNPYQNPPSPYYRPNPNGIQGGLDEQTLSMAMWILMIFVHIISPLIFLVISSNSPFVRANSIMAMGVYIFGIILDICFLLVALLLGPFGIVVELLMIYPALIMPIQGAIAARNGYLYEPPFIGPLMRSWSRI